VCGGFEFGTQSFPEMRALLGIGLDIFEILDHEIVRGPRLWAKKKPKPVCIRTYVKRSMINLKYVRKVLIIIVSDNNNKNGDIGVA
jgi:hypothetical protein